MLLTTTKKRINTHSSSLGSIFSDISHFLSSLSLFLYQLPRLPPYHQNYLNSPLSKPQSRYLRPSLLIGTLEGADAMLLKACEAIEYEVRKGLDSRLVDQSPELEDNEVYLYWNLESDKDNSEDDWIAKDSESENSDIKTTSSHASSN